MPHVCIFVMNIYIYISYLAQAAGMSRNETSPGYYELKDSCLKLQQLLKKSKSRVAGIQQTRWTKFSDGPKFGVRILKPGHAWIVVVIDDVGRFYIALFSTLEQTVILHE